MSTHSLNSFRVQPARALVLAMLAAAGCQSGRISGTAEQTHTQDESETVQLIQDDVVGARLELPADWTIQREPALFSTYGFVVFAPGGDDASYTPISDRLESPVARVAVAYDAVSAPGRHGGVATECVGVSA